MRLKYHIYCLQGTSNFVPGNEMDKPCTHEGEIEMILPSKKLRNIKLDFKNSLLQQPQEGGLFDGKGSATLTYNDDKTIKFDGSHKHSGIMDLEHPHESDLKVALTILKLAPLIMSDSYKYTPDGDKVKMSSSTNVNYGGKELSLDIDNLEYDRDLTSIKMDGKATTPYEKMRRIEYTFKHQVLCSRATAV